MRCAPVRVSLILLTFALGCKPAAPAAPPAPVTPAAPTPVAAAPAPAAAAAAAAPPVVGAPGAVPVVGAPAAVGAAPAPAAAPGQPAAATAGPPMAPPGGTAWVLGPEVQIPANIPPPVWAAAPIKLPPLPQLQLIQNGLVGAAVDSVTNLAIKPRLAVNVALGTPFQMPAEDDGAFLEVFGDKPFGTKGGSSHEVWYVEGQLVGVLVNVPSHPSAVEALTKLMGREKDIPGALLGDATRVAWVAGNEIIMAHHGKKAERVWIMTTAGFKRWRQLSAPTEQVAPLITAGYAALRKKPLDLVAAENSFKAVVATLPYHHRAWSRLAKIAYLRGDYVEAARICDTALATVKDPDTRGDILYYRAMTHVQAAETSAALENLRQGLALGVTAPESQARFNALSGKYDKPTLKIALREFRCASQGHALRPDQVTKEFPGLNMMTVEQRLQAQLDPMAYQEFLMKLDRECGMAMDGSEGEEGHW